jgi:hypothetical protein
MIFALISGVFLIVPLFKPIIALCENGLLNAASPLNAYDLARITLAITVGISGIQRRSRIPDQTKFLYRILDLGDFAHEPFFGSVSPLLASA